MKLYLQSKWLRVLAVVIVALGSAWAVGAVHDTYKVAKMTEKMQTVCVGRMLIDLPEEARVELYRGWIDGFDIEAYEENNVVFQSRVAAREAEIRAKRDRLGGNNNMESVREVKTDSGMTGKVFVHSRNVTEGTANKGIDGIEHFRYEGVALEAHVHAGGISIDVETDDYDPDRIDHLSKLVAQLVANPDNRIPTEPGFCIDHAYIRDPLKAEQGERVNMAAVLPSYPDIEIRFDTIAGTKPDGQGLLERSAAAHARAPLAVNTRFTKLRAASRTIGGLTGDELVERVLEENFSIVYGFQWEVNGKQDDVFIPDLLLLMKTGTGKEGQVPSSLAQAAAMSLWDKISSSIRLRPTESPKLGAAEPPESPLGTFASAGDPCPQSGWWLCGDGGNGIGVQGGERQYIRRGKSMPQALLLMPQTVSEKMRGLQSSYETKTRTLWRLVEKRSRKRIEANLPLGQPTPAPAATTTAAVLGVNAIEPQTSVGTYVTTAEACPSSGWWRCEESDALDGTRWFAKGTLLPPATFAVSSDAFRKSAGTPKTIQRRGTWQLVRLAQAPEVAGNSGDAPGQTTDKAKPESPPDSAT